MSGLLHWLGFHTWERTGDTFWGSGRDSGYYECRKCERIKVRLLGGFGYTKPDEGTAYDRSVLPWWHPA